MKRVGLFLASFLLFSVESGTAPSLNPSIIAFYLTRENVVWDSDVLRNGISLDNEVYTFFKGASVGQAMSGKFTKSTKTTQKKICDGIWTVGLISGTSLCTFTLQGDNRRELNSVKFNVVTPTIGNSFKFSTNKNEIQFIKQ